MRELHARCTLTFASVARWARPEFAELSICCLISTPLEQAARRVGSLHLPRQRLRMVMLLLASALGACTLATSIGSPTSYGALTERPRGSPTERLLRDGYAVLDGALTPAEVREVRKGCASLQARGAMQHLGQEGRDDSVCVLDPSRLDHPSYGALSLAAQRLLDLPHMLVAGGSQACHAGLEPRISRQGPRQACYSHA